MGACRSQSAQKGKNVTQKEIFVEVMSNSVNIGIPQKETSFIQIDVKNQAQSNQNKEFNNQQSKNIIQEKKANENVQIIPDSPRFPQLMQFQEAKCQQEIQNVEINDNEPIDVDAKMGEISEQIEIELIPRQNQIQILPNSQTLPCIAKIRMNTQQHHGGRNNMDLICLVDVSGSMSGEKIKNVQNSLRYIQKILGPEDKFAIVSFHTWAQLIQDWTFSSPENKKEIKSNIKHLITLGSTNLAAGFDLCLKTISMRKQKNSFCSIFLLTDGQDDDTNVIERCQNIIKKYDIQETIVMHTFGYGAEHDAIALNGLANLTGGKFIYIKEIEKAAENFILCLSGMLSIVAIDLQFSITETAPQYKISKTFGKWKHKLLENQKNQFTHNIVHLCEKAEMKLKFELEILADHQLKFDDAIVVQACISGTIIKLQKPFFKQQELRIKFTSQPVQFEQNEELEVNYLRAIAGEKIGEAMNYASIKNYDQAQQILKQIQIQVENSAFKDNLALLVLKNDLIQTREMCKPQIQQFDREAVMLKKQANHIQANISLNNSGEWNSDQEMYIEQVRNGGLNLTQSIGAQRDNQNNRNSENGSYNLEQLLEQQNQDLENEQSPKFRQSNISAILYEADVFEKPYD